MFLLIVFAKSHTDINDNQLIVRRIKEVPNKNKSRLKKNNLLIKNKLNEVHYSFCSLFQTLGSEKDLKTSTSLSISFNHFYEVFN
jgi:hypothetical protein